ncbi:hypothetical protein GCM10023190_07180 [Enteractinococcus fodinae]|uniref:Type II secretory pathway component PulM n=1 Tax=Enteractinococcus fodinae TaxID=684663 RepID=A0ABU2AZN2_9MICC|nr:hypothetical protein [Enteractinococcus fodinae]MDR7346805.1 type II secretory pathway component PulM [Enteractinococcus fodinae]
MKSLGGIGAIILGVVAILVSVGLQTIWAPPAEFNATTQDTQEAPLTIVTEGIDVDPDDSIEYTVTGDGEFTLMYGQLRDVEAWVGDAAHNRIDGVNTDVARGEDPTVNITYVDGEAEVPNPVNSDLWLATQDVTDEVTQRWTSSDAGQWALLIAADGTAPAPADFSVSWVNVEPNSPLITPLMIAGIVLILVGIALLIWRFLEFRRRAKRTSGRRAAVRGDYTGLTAADVRADTDSTQEIMSIQQVQTGEPVTKTQDATLIEEAGGDDPDLAVSDPATPEETSPEADPDDSDTPNDSDDFSGGSTAPDADEPTETLPVQDDTDDDGKPRDSGFLRRTVTALTALGLAAGLGIGPAHAEPTEPENEDIEEQIDEEQIEDEADAEETETFPVVVDTQLERILDAVAATVQRGDDELDADVLTGRVAGQALRVRENFYGNLGIEDDYAQPNTIASDQILAAWMERDDSFPRTIYAVTTDEDGAEIQLLVLRQQDPRAQYQLISNAPFAPGAEIPAGNLSDEEVEEIPGDEAAGLVMSPDAAIEALADYLTDPDAEAADSIADNEWIDLIHNHQAELEETHGEHDTDVSISRSVFDDSVNAVRLQDGSALVFGAMNSLESLMPEEDATVTLNPLTQEMGDFSTDEAEDQVRIRYREQFALHIPAEGEISLVGYETVQSTVD